MRLPEFTRSTTLPWSSPAWPYLLWLWPESSASRYCGQFIIFLILADVAAALVRPGGGGKPATEGQQAPRCWKKEKNDA
jgi:hypothetical protein